MVCVFEEPGVAVVVVLLCGEVVFLCCGAGGVETRGSLVRA